MSLLHPLLISLFLVSLSSSELSLSSHHRSPPSPRTEAATTVFLKNKLLDNLNKYFDASTDGELEILSAPPRPDDSPLEGGNGIWNNPAQMIPSSLDWASSHPAPAASSPFQLPQSISDLLQPPPSPLFSLAFPQLPFTPAQPPQPPLGVAPLPPMPSPPPPRPTPQLPRPTSPPISSPHRPIHRVIRERPLPAQVDSEHTKESRQSRLSRPKKRRSDGLTRDVIDNVRDWRRRLYKAFKQRDEEPRQVIRVLTNSTFGLGQVVEFTDSSPVAHERRVPSAKSRDEEPKQQRKIRTEKTGQMFGMERSGYRYNNQPAPAISPIKESPPLPPAIPMAEAQQEQRPSVFFVQQPAPPPSSQASFSLPAFPTLSPVSFPSSRMRLQPPSPQQIPPSSLILYDNHTPSPFLPELVTPVQLQDNAMMSPDYSNEGDILFSAKGTQCVPGDVMCEETTQEINEDKCNSLRLRQIIEDNIVAEDAESSKRSVQGAAEQLFNRYFDAVCGTGFFSYIAHTDEFCQASARGVNCYLFSPVCSPPPADGIFPFKQKKKKSVNRN